ncbi:flagellar motor switch protein FliG [Motiliproteus sp. SC1-56]|uniref:flagellar motor switch protein FliG n=1 Tax=Motiliproteus sp. SC1-56 TaxID=2799565 RepID=UPI001A901FCA|nr:flagellar motor switch protein FliG [Motiliproteus sp. SC1-56]
MSDDISNLSAVDRAAVLLMTLGESDAAEVLKHMGPKEVQRLGSAMSRVSNIHQDQVETVMADFLNTVGNQTGLGVGSDNYIRSVLTQALGEEKAGGVIDRILEGGNTKGLDTLKWMDARQVADVIRYEHPQIQAIVVSYLDADQASEVLTYFDEKVRLDVLMRISALETVQPSALQELNDILERQFVGSTQSKTTSMGGVKVVADIMNYFDSSTEATVMEAIKEVDEDLGLEIQDMMFVFANLADIDDRGIQTILREISTDVLVVALKGADTVLQEKIFSNMSKRAAELLRDDLEAAPPVRVSDVEAAQKEILAVARRLADEGEIMLGGSGEEMI